MAPFKKLRTYENPKRKNTKPAILTDIVVNLTNIGLSLETSSDISRETTFDRLKKGEIYNNIVFTSFSKPNYSSSADLSSYSLLEYKKKGYQNESVDMERSDLNIAKEPSTCEQNESSTNKPYSAIQTCKKLTAHIFRTDFDRSPIVTRSKLKLQPNSDTQKVNIERCNEKNKQEFLMSKKNMSLQYDQEKNNSSSCILSESLTKNHSESNNTEKLELPPNSDNQKFDIERCNEKNKQEFLTSKKNMSLQYDQEKNNSSSCILSESLTKNHSESNNTEKLELPPNSDNQKFDIERCNEKNQHEVLASKENMSFQYDQEKKNSSSYILSESSTRNHSASNNINKLVRKRKLHNHHFHLNISGFNFKRLKSKCSTPKVIFSKTINKLSAEQKSNEYESIKKHINVSILNSVKHLSLSYKDKYKFKENSQPSNIETSKNNYITQSICEFDSENMPPPHFDSQQHHATSQNNVLPSLPSSIITSTPVRKPKFAMDFINISSENEINYSAEESTNKICSKISKLESNNKMEKWQAFEQFNYTKHLNTQEKSVNCPNALENSENQDIVDSSIISEQPIMKKYLSLAAGKKFRRSIIIHRNTMDVSRNCTELGPNDIKKNSIFSRRTSIKVVPLMSIRTTISKLKNCTANSTVLEEDLRDDSKYNSNNHLPLIHESTQDSKEKYNSDDHLPHICRSPRDIVLKRCGQTEPLNFDECYPQSTLRNCQKIGEGVYGEVFMYQDQDQNSSVIVMKIIPIEGDQIVNLEKQKTFEEIISEIVITAELSDLRKHKCNKTDAFTEVVKIRCVKGCYPKRLLELWDLYDENKQSENDSPEIFKSDQLYIILELSNGGRDLESYEFQNAQQSLSVFNQIACAIAVAEEELHFEHRDLHWGNVLVKVTKEEYSNFLLKGREITIKNKEVKATIIDFTLSRIEYDKAVIFNDLALDNDLFSATGDYQFEIYRLMKKNNGNEWQSFKPYSNVLWLHYVLDKAITAFRYKKTQSKLHKTSLSTLKKYKAKILNYQSVTEFVLNNFVS